MATRCHLRHRISPNILLGDRYFRRFPLAPYILCYLQYHFLVDLSFEDADRYRQSVEAIRPLTEKLNILGEYKRGQRII